MGTFDDSTPKVRPLGEENPPPTPDPRGVIGVVLVVAMAGAIFLTIDPTQSPTENVALPPLATTSSTSTTSQPAQATHPADPSLPVTDLGLALSARMAELLDEANAIWDVVPDADGKLVVALGTQTGTDLIRVTGDRASVRLDSPILDWHPLNFDQSGQYLAYIRNSATTDSPALFLEYDTSAIIIEGVSSFEWHATIGGRIAWISVGPESQLCWYDIGQGEPSRPECFPGPANEYQLVGFDDDGFLAIDRGGRAIVRLGIDGQRVASMNGDDVAIGPGGRLLIIDHTGERNVATVTDSDFTDPARLEWAPPNAFIAPIWSPSAAYPEIAFLTSENGHFGLRVWDLDGKLTHSIDLEGRLWGLEWDSTGRYILIPGALDETSRDPVHILYVYDTSMDQLATLPFGGWVRQVALVTPVFCEDADHVTATLSRRMPPDITLQSAQLIKSRDAKLLAFSFLSGLVSGGPHDGAIATWALPGYWSTAEDDTPDRLVAINEAARRLDIHTMDDEFAISDWMAVDGAIGSQQCVTNTPPLAPDLP